MKAPNTTFLSRRTLVRAFPFIGAAVATPIDIAKAAELLAPSAPADLIGFPLAAHYAQKLAEAMAAPDFPGTGWTITVKSGDPDQHLTFGKDMAPKLSATGRAKSLAWQLAFAMNQIAPGNWIADVQPANNFALVYAIPSTVDSAGA